MITFFSVILHLRVRGQCVDINSHDLNTNLSLLQRADEENSKGIGTPSNQALNL